MSEKGAYMRYEKRIKLCDIITAGYDMQYV